MSVDFESYQPSDPPDDGTNGRRILEHLAQHPELGFTPSELADDLEIPRRSVGTTLGRLEECGLVRHNGEYWASSRAYDAHTASELGLRAVADQFEGDHYGTNPDWDATLPDVDAETSGECCSTVEASSSPPIYGHTP